MKQKGKKKTLKQKPLLFLRMGLMHKTDVHSMSKQGGNSITVPQDDHNIQRYKNNCTSCHRSI